MPATRDPAAIARSSGWTGGAVTIPRQDRSGQSTNRTLGPGTIYELVAPRWRKYGMDQVTIAGAIILAESGGKVNATNVNGDGSTDRGPWQINNRWHPEVTDECAFDPVCASDAALRIYQGAGNSFSPWATFTSGAYKQEKAPTIKDADVKGSLGTLPGVGGLLDWTEGLSKLLSNLLDPQWWLRVGMIVLGGLALVIAALLLAREYLPMPPVVKALT